MLWFDENRPSTVPKSREVSSFDETDAKDTTRFPGLFGTCMSMETATTHMLVAGAKGQLGVRLMEAATVAGVSAAGLDREGMRCAARHGVERERSDIRAHVHQGARCGWGGVRAPATGQVFPLTLVGSAPRPPGRSSP